MNNYYLCQCKNAFADAKMLLPMQKCFRWWKIGSILLLDSMCFIRNVTLFIISHDRFSFYLAWDYIKWRAQRVVYICSALWRGDNHLLYCDVALVYSCVRTQYTGMCLIMMHARLGNASGRMWSTGYNRASGRWVLVSGRIKYVADVLALITNLTVIC